LSTQHGRDLLRSLLADPKGTDKYISYHLTEAMFQGTEIDLFEQVNTHIEKYGRLPKAATIATEIPDDLDVPEYYFDHVKHRYEHREIVRGMKRAQDRLQNKDPQAALDELRETVVALTMAGQKTHMVDFSSDAAKVLDDEYKMLSKHFDVDAPGVGTGYPSLDKMGRMRGGDVLALVGRPQQGKTYQLLNMAHNAWNVQNKRTLFISMEMRPLPLIQRIAALHRKMSVTELRRGEYPIEVHKELITSLQKLENSHDRFWIVDGNLAASVDDIHALVHQTNPDVLYVDGGYLLQAREKRIPRYERVNQTLEFLKQEISTNLGVPVFVSYQFNKQGAKDKELENIAGSDSIGQLASIVCALWESEENEAECSTSKTVEIIKGRNGEQGSFRINWSFDRPPFMQFDEIIEDDHHDLSMEVYV
jgi:replicative DNA helicase